MFIQSINSYNNQRYAPISHKSWTRTVHKENGSRFVKEVLHRNDTFLFREEELWEFLRKYLVAKYNNVRKVNVYNYGCSNGSEACTFLMTMFGNNDAEVAKKFTPIIAKDYDSYAIEKAKTRLLPIVPFERYLINTYTDNQFDKFLERVYKQDESGKELYKIKPQYSSKIKYSVADIRQDYKMIRPDNSIIFARNFWVYLPLEDRKELAKNLYNQMGKNSMLILGEFDLYGTSEYRQNTITEILKSCGFEKHPRLFIFEK